MLKSRCQRHVVVLFLSGLLLQGCHYQLDTHPSKEETQEDLIYQEQVLKKRRVLYGDKPHPDLASSLDSVGTAYTALGEVQKGLDYQEQALEMRKILYGDAPHPDTANSLNNVGIAYEKLGKVHQAITHQEQELEMLKALHGGAPHPDIADSLGNLGEAYGTLGDARKGLICQEQALKMRRALYGDAPHLDIASSLNSVGESYEMLDEVQKAIQHYEEALKFLPKECIFFKQLICYNLGRMYYIKAMSMDSVEVRQVHCDQAMEAFETAIAVDDMPLVGVMVEYANFLIATAELPRAYNLLTSAIASGDSDSELGYGVLEQTTVSPVLQERITQDGCVSLRAVDYAYYLLIYHYEAFVQAGIQPENTRKDYLGAYEENIKSSVGQPDKEEESELAQFLLDSLST